MLQATTVRYLGVFLEDPLAVPWPVVEYLAEQLGMDDPSCVKRYAERPKTAYEHAWEIRDAYGYRMFDEASGRRGVPPVPARPGVDACRGAEALFDHAVGWLRRNRVLLPGMSRAGPAGAKVREAADERLHATARERRRRGGPGAAGAVWRRR